MASWGKRGPTPTSYSYLLLLLAVPPPLYLPQVREAGIPVDVAALERMGVRAIAVPCTRDAQGRALYEPQGVVDALSRLLEQSGSSSSTATGSRQPEGIQDGIRPTA